MANLLDHFLEIVNNLIDILSSGINIIYSSFDFMPQEIKMILVTVLSIAFAVFIYKLIK